MSAPKPVDVMAICDLAIFQRKRRLQLMFNKGAPDRSIERQRMHIAAAEAARAEVDELIERRARDAAVERLIAATTDIRSVVLAGDWPTDEQWARQDAALADVCGGTA